MIKIKVGLHLYVMLVCGVSSHLASQDPPLLLTSLHPFSSSLFNFVLSWQTDFLACSPIHSSQWFSRSGWAGVGHRCSLKSPKSPCFILEIQLKNFQLMVVVSKGWVITPCIYQTNTIQPLTIVPKGILQVQMPRKRRSLSQGFLWCL